MEDLSEENLILIKKIVSELETQPAIEIEMKDLQQRYGKASVILSKILFNSKYKNEIEILQQIKGMDKK